MQIQFCRSGTQFVQKAAGEAPEMLLPVYKISRRHI
jgi:hypothetical protein